MPQKQKDAVRTSLIAKTSDKNNVISHGKHRKHRKATPAVPLPLGGGREGAFPFRGGFRRGLGGVRGGVYLTRKAQKAQKSYASGSPPFGEDGRGLFPLGEDLGEAVEGLGVGSISHGKHRKHRKHSHKERPQLPFPSPRRGGGRGGDIIIIVPLFERICNPLVWS